MTDVKGLCERLRAKHSDPIGCGLVRHWDVNPDGHEAAALIEQLQAEVERRDTLLRKLEPYLDSLICYASTIGEHEPNKIAQEVRALLQPKEQQS